MKNTVYLLIGGNLGERFELLTKAKRSIQEEIGVITKESSVYETAPWGFNSDNNFLNQVLIVNTELPPTQVLKKCQEIENALGRKRTGQHYSSRTMDVDILFYDALIINEPNLIVPHPKLHERRFTLEPLAEIAPEFTHPVLKKTMTELLNERGDQSDVRKLKN